MKINIDELTIKEVRELQALLGNAATPQSPHPFTIGANYFIRTVTHHHTGRLVAVGDKELVLENAAWIADDGRLTDALKSGTFNEVEMFPIDAKVIVGRGSIIDALIVSTIPTSQK
jgi:hypothetical protein